MLRVLRSVLRMFARPKGVTSSQPKAPDSVIEDRRVSLVNAEGTADFTAIYGALYAHRGRPESFIERVAAGFEGDWFPAKVVGVSHKNDDRTSRQAAIRKLDRLASIELEPEPTNPYDKDAIRVLNEDDRQIGYLEKRLASETSRAMRQGTHFLCLVLEVTGDDEPTRGVNIAIIRWTPKPQL